MHTHITRAHLKGYRNIRDTEATFREGLNIIIGKNGTGKSNFLWLLANISNDKTNDIRISAEIDGSLIIYNVGNLPFSQKIIHEYNTNYQIEKKDIDILNNKRIIGTGLMDSIFILLKFNIPTDIDAFSKAKSISSDIINEGLRKTIIPFTNNWVLKNMISDKNFSKTHQFTIADLNFKQDTINILKKYTPIQDIRVEFPQRADEIKIFDNEIQISNLLYGFKISNEWFKWEELSDGTRRIIWIVLNVLIGNGSITLIEEPELGIHPQQLQLLMEFLKDQSANKQIILTTHSPEVLDVLDEDELGCIQIARYDEVRKTTIIEPLSQQKQTNILKYFKAEGLLSTYWSNIGLDSK